MAEMTGVLLDEVNEYPSEAVKAALAPLYVIEICLTEDGISFGSLGHEDIQRVGHRGLGRWVKVTIGVAIGMRFVSVEMPNLETSERPLRPPAVDFGGVTQQTKQREVARRA